MPQPTITGAPLTLKFGGLALPNGQGTMTQMNLNDGVQWQWQDFKYDFDVMQLAVGQLAWRARSTVLGRDRKARVLTLPMRYQEASAAPSAAFGVQLGLIEQAGRQQLTTDNATFIGAEFSGLKGISWVKKFPPFYLAFNLEFLCQEPYFRDLSATAVSPVTLNSGTATNFNVTYLGSVFCEPVWTLAIPNNTVAIASLRLQNTMSGDDMTVTFPGNLPANTAATVAIDTSAQTVTDANGVAYDIGGGLSFPLLYGPAGQVQQIRATLTPASGMAVGCTIAGSYTNRWMI